MIAIILAYYTSLLLHEWGHGTIAWLYGVKISPFDVNYGGWLLMNADENVPYSQLISTGQGLAAAFIGIAGFTVSFIFVIASFLALNRKNISSNSTLYILVYWFLIINMIPLIQYLVISPFSSEGDTGRFIQGLNISPWLVFIPGIAFITWSIWRILRIEMIRGYAVIPIKSQLSQSIFLLTTLGFMFLLIYTHGYNPLTDSGMNAFGRVLALASIILVPILFIICNPRRAWVRKSLNILLETSHMRTN